MSIVNRYLSICYPRKPWWGRTFRWSGRGCKRRVRIGAKSVGSWRRRSSRRRCWRSPERDPTSTTSRKTPFASQSRTSLWYKSYFFQGLRAKVTLYEWKLVELYAKERILDQNLKDLWIFEKTEKLWNEKQKFIFLPPWTDYWGFDFEFNSIIAKINLLVDNKMLVNLFFYIVFILHKFQNFLKWPKSDNK